MMVMVMPISVTKNKSNDTCHQVLINFSPECRLEENKIFVKPAIFSVEREGISGGAFKLNFTFLNVDDFNGRCEQPTVFNKNAN